MLDPGWPQADEGPALTEFMPPSEDHCRIITHEACGHVWEAVGTCKGGSLPDLFAGSNFIYVSFFFLLLSNFLIPLILYFHHDKCTLIPSPISPILPLPAPPPQ